MKYFLLIFLAGPVPSVTSIGPFDDLFACEKAAGQVAVTSRKASTVCVSTKAYVLSAAPK